jgi:hypothetical protein
MPPPGPDASVPEPDPDPEPDAAALAPMDAGPPLTCVAIRNCVARCQADNACAQRCVTEAAAPARTSYEKVVICSRQACATAEIECRCEEECQGGGMCVDIVDECRAPGEDLFCDQLCT